ncbi:MAG: ribosome recycling factor [Patescibacteria group bacterium]|nr:ribosome recycling factor [Patescibacteria group bacterium]
MHPIIESHRTQFTAVIDTAKRELGAIRTGRANPLVVEQISVEAYGARTPLRQVASISVPEPSVIAIEPWDKSIIKDIERAIVEARLGLQPSVSGTTLRLTMPPLTTETRTELTRTAKQKIEQFRVRIRSLRDKVREEITKAEKSKSITQDDRYEAFKHADELTKNFTAQLKDLEDRKVQEINTV